MYQLYIDKENFKLKIYPIQACLKYDRQILMYKSRGRDDEILHYNDLYAICKTRKVLLQYARNIKAEWLQEAKDRVEQIEAIKI